MDRHLHKEQRLYRESEIQLLFAKGKHMQVGPVHAVLRMRNDGGEPRLMVSVSKKRFKHAVDRVRVKRILRESYRLRKPSLDADIALLYMDTVLPESATIHEAVEQILNQYTQRFHRGK